MLVDRTASLSCGGDQVHVDVLLSANETINPLVDISNNMKTGTSQGVFFILERIGLMYQFRLMTRNQAAIAHDTIGFDRTQSAS